ncbi:MAG: AsmA-like C-terminal region-containing protein, partial [Gammaproteobacteria bacterium]|jgi:hypothetical protein
LLQLSLPPLKEWRNRTQFDKSSATWRVNKGVAVNKDLNMESKHLIIKGAGKINLAKRYLDYKLETRLKGDFWEGDWLVPINIKGSFAKPNITLDNFSLLHEISKNIMPQNIVLRAIKIVTTPFRLFYYSLKPTPKRPER